MVQILALSKHLVESRNVIESLAQAVPICGKAISAASEKDDQTTQRSCQMSEAKLSQLSSAHAQIRHLVKDTKERLNLLSYQEDASKKGSDTCTSVGITLRKLGDSLSNFSLLTAEAGEGLNKLLESFEKQAEQITQSANDLSRAKLVCTKALIRASEIRENYLATTNTQDVGMIDENSGSAGFDKTVKQVENLVKLCMQRIVTSFKALEDGDQDGVSQRKASLTADGTDPLPANQSGVAKDADQVNDSMIQKETSIEEMVAFAKNFQAVLEDAKTAKLIGKSKQVFALRGVLDSVDSKTL